MEELIHDLENEIKDNSSYVLSILRPEMLLSSLKDLNNMIGNNDLKNDVARQVDYLIDSRNDTESDEPIMLHSLLYGGPGTGKCLGKNTPVMMYDGSIHLVQDIKTGDVLMGDNSLPRRVLSTTTGTEMMYKVNQSYGDNYIVNESHILSLKLSKNPNLASNNISFFVKWFEKEGIRSKFFSYKNSIKKDVKKVAKKFLDSLPKIGSIIDIELRDYIKRNKEWKSVYKGYKVGIEYPKKDISFSPYILGVWLGNSSSHDKISIMNRKIYPHSNIRFSLKTSSSIFLEKANLLNTEHIPEKYLFNTRNIRLELLAGLIDIGGYYYNDNICIIQKNKILAYDILRLSRSLEFKSDISSQQNLYIISISGDIEKIPIKLDGKKSTEKNYLLYDIEIIPQKVDQYYGFEIDKNGRFLLGDFTVTHNTTIGKHLARIWYSLGYIGKKREVTKQYRSSTDTKTKKNTDINNLIDGLLSDNMDDFQNSYLKLVIIGLILSALAVVWGYIWSAIKVCYNLLGLKWLLIVLGILIIIIIISFIYFFITGTKYCNICKKTKCVCPQTQKKTEENKTEVKLPENTAIKDDELIDIVSSEDFIGQYVGWTEKKTAELLQKSKGKVLFIDEAYSLISSNGIGDSYGEKALNIINRYMSECPEDSAIIMAGYEDKIKNNLFKTQPGLARRFMWSFNCKGYTIEELFDIWKQQIKPKILIDEKKTLEIFMENRYIFPNFAGDTLRLVNFVKLEQKNDNRKRKSNNSNASGQISLNQITPDQTLRAIQVLARNSVKTSQSLGGATLTPEMLNLFNMMSKANSSS